MTSDFHKLAGAGLPNVFLDGGVLLEGRGDNQTVSYADLEGLYAAIARALALRTGPMLACELRFLRKRLGYSQTDVARLGGKTEQAVAKWEKGLTPVPKAEASLIRLAGIARFGTRADVAKAVKALLAEPATTDCPVLVFRFDAGQWTQNEAMAALIAGRRSRLEVGGAVEAQVESQGSA